MFFLITGAAGFVGRAVTGQLAAAGHRVRALVLPGDPMVRYLPEEARQVAGDLATGEGLDAFFDVPEGEQATVIHAAGIVSIAWHKQSLVRQVNVGGTRRVVEACVRRGFRLIHVASVHAIREQPRGQTMAEPTGFDPKAVVGGYAQTKAEAAALVEEARRRGLNACIVLPSGIIGPGDYAGSHITAMIRGVLRGKMFAGVRGGYNFVDVRDVADGIAALCASPGCEGCYNLTGHTVSIRQFFDAICDADGEARRVRRYLPRWVASLALPAFALRYRIRGEKPVFTRYSLYTLGANADFCHEKAEETLGYRPRPFAETVRDTVRWMKGTGWA